MKNLIITAILITAIAFGVKAQTIDTAFKHGPAVKIQPFKAKFSDTSNVTHLSVTVVSDNLKTAPAGKASVSWRVMTDKGILSVNGTLNMTGADYVAGGISLLDAYKYVCKKLSLTAL